MLRFATTSNKGSQTDASAHVFAESVAKRTAGRIRIEIYESGSLGGEKEIAEEVVGGSLDFAVVSSAGYAGPGVLPSLGVFDVPFLFRDVAHARAVLDGPIGTAKLREMSKAGVVGLAWAENGVRHLTTRDRAVRTPADLAGLKIRVPQSEVLVSTFKALGAEPTPIPFPDLYAALATGTVAAQENPVANIRSSGFDKVQSYLCLTGHVYSPMIVMASQATMARLSPEDRDAVVAAGRDANAAARKFNDDKQDEYLKDLQSKGMTVVADIDRGAFIKALAGAEPAFQSMFGSELLSSIRNFGL